jgi:dTDP-6-deoxy-L-talose 4-dehydrogenase (NAD+)
MYLKKKNFLITGSTGFIGKRLLDHLRNKKINITLVVREKSKINKRLIQDLSINKIISVKNIFSKKKSWWNQICKDIDVVIHLAWYVKHPEYINSKKNLECYKGTIELAKACVKNKVKKFVGLGTCAEYEPSTKKLQRDSKLHSVNRYGRYKIKTFNHLKKIFKNKVNFLWCRVFYIYGEEQNSKRLFPYLNNIIKKNKKKAILSEGKQIRDFVHVEDAVRQIIKLVFSRYRGGVNICTGKPMSIKNFSKKVLKKSKRKIELIFSKNKKNIFDPPFVIGVKTLDK